MRKITKLLTLALAALMIIGVMPASAAFTDVSVENEALFEAVELLTTLNVAKGTTATTFGPDELVTRQQMAAFVYRLMKAGRSSEGGSNTTPFTDLQDSTFFNMISWANSAGVIKGISATEFNPKGNITLQDAYVMVVRALGYEKDTTLNYPFDYIDLAEEIGLDEDIPSTVDYTDNLTRGQVAIILANAFYADMNETVLDYEWKLAPNNTDYAYVAVEKTETIASKIFGVEEQTMFVTATTHYGFDNSSALYNELDDTDKVGGLRYDDKGIQIGTGEFTFDMDDLGLEGTSDDYFLSELTLFVREGDTADDDEVIAAKSNLVKKTVTAADVEIERSGKSDSKYYVDNDKDNEKIMTGFVNFGGLKAYLDIDNAPYSYSKIDNSAAFATGVNTNSYEKNSVRFIYLDSSSYDEEGNTTFHYDYTLANDNFDSVYSTTTLDALSKAFKTAYPTVYTEGLYEADVLDPNGDGYAEFVFVKNYTFFEIIDKKNTKFNGLRKYSNIDVEYAIYTEDATIEGDYKSGDEVLGYIDAPNKYVKIGKVVTPTEVKALATNDNDKTATFSNVGTLEFEDREFNYKPAYTGYVAATDAADYDDFTLAKTYNAYIADGVVLYTTNLGGSGEFDEAADYVIVLPYDVEDTSYVYPENGTSANKATDKILHSSTIFDGEELKTIYFVNVLINGKVKAVKLAEYANTHYNYSESSTGANDWAFKKNTGNDVESQKITDAKIAESVMYHDFLYNYATYTVNAAGEYTFTALNFETDVAKLTGTNNEETAVLLGQGYVSDTVYGKALSLKNYTGNIYTIEDAAFEGLAKDTRFYVRDYSKIVIKEKDSDGEDVYTVYTGATLPKFDKTAFTNAFGVFVNNTNGTFDNLALLYAEIGTGSFASKGTQDYRIVVGSSQGLDEDEKVVTYYSVINPKDASKVDNVEATAATVGTIATNSYVIMKEDGKIEKVTAGGAYAENEIFSANFVSFDTENNFLDISIDNLTYIVNEETKIMFYEKNNKYQMVESDILTLKDNAYIEDPTTLWDYENDRVQSGKGLALEIVAVDGDDNDNTDIKVAKTIVVKPSGF